MWGWRGIGGGVRGRAKDAASTSLCYHLLYHGRGGEDAQSQQPVLIYGSFSWDLAPDLCIGRGWEGGGAST